MLVCLALTAKRIDREVHLSALRAGFAVDEEGRIPMNAYPDLARLHGMIAVWSRTDLKQLRYGVSITDACLGWKDTEVLLRKGYESLRK